MERYPVPYNHDRVEGILVPQPQIPQEAMKTAASRAPSTIAGLTAGGILGALVAGPHGALLLGIFGGLIGYSRDTKPNR